MTLPGDRQFTSESFAQVGGLQFFAVNAGDRVELWRTDGTAPGTLSVARLAFGAALRVTRRRETGTQV